MSTGLRGLPLGGALEIDFNEANKVRISFQNTLLRQQSDEPRQINPARSDYSAATGSTSLVPSQPGEGVALPYGRAWAEARSVTTSAGSSVAVALVATQNGVRAIVTANPGATITGGTVRFWVFDPITQTWALGGVEETLPTGVRSVATSDQFVTVGGT